MSTVKNLIKELLGSKYIFKITFNFLTSKANKIYFVNYHNTYPCNNENFFRHLEFYKEYFEIIDPKKINSISSGNTKPQLILTFDDGNASNFQISNILYERGISAIFAIPYNYISRSSEPTIEREISIAKSKFKIFPDLKQEIESSSFRTSLSEHQIKKMSKMGHEISSHTCNHTRLSSKLKKSEFYYEIVISKKLLEGVINKKVKFFTWVGGELSSYSKNAFDLISKNYEYSLMTCNKAWSKEQSNYHIHRFNIESSFSLNKVRITLGGIYQLKYFFKRALVDFITS